MYKYLALIGLLLIAGCSHARFGVSCPDYCFSQGGYCDYVERGHRDYNTTTGEYRESPTVFHCKFER